MDGSVSGYRGGETRRPRGSGCTGGALVVGWLAMGTLCFIMPAVAWAQADDETARAGRDDASGRTMDLAALELLGDESASSTEGSDEASAPSSQGVSTDRQYEARAVFLEANQLARDRFFATAAARYKQAIAIWPHPAFRYNLALAQLELDQIIEARGSLERALQEDAEALGDKQEPARRQLAILDSQLGRIEVSCDEPGAQVMLDGQPLFTGAGRHESVVRPGVHQLVATKPGLAPVVQQVVLAPGERGRFGLAFQYPEVTVTERRWAAWKSWSVVGAGAVLTLGSTYLDWHSTRAFDEYDGEIKDRCRPMQGCTDEDLDPALEDARQRAQSEQHMAMAGYITGGAVLATGAVLVYLNRARQVRRQARPESSSLGALTPIISAEVAGVRAVFRF